MKCRKARVSDLTILKELWYESFAMHDGKESIDFYFNNNFDLEHTFVLENENNEIVTSLQLNQHQLYLNNSIENVSFVIGVATFEKHQRKGYMRILLDYAIDFAKNELKQNYMILQAYNWDVYRPFGFVEYYYKSKSDVKLEDLKEEDETSLKSSDSKELLTIYNKYTATLNGYKIRSTDYYNDMLISLESEGIYISQSSNAYVFYTINDSKINVLECAYVTKKDLNMLLKTVMITRDISNCTIMSDILNYDLSSKELFMMIKELDSCNIKQTGNEYISEWI